MSSTEERLAAALADRYRVEREVGQGGMATVYLAQDLKHNRKGAIKVLGALRLNPGFASLRNDPRFVKLLESAPK